MSFCQKSLCQMPWSHFYGSTLFFQKKNPKHSLHLTNTNTFSSLHTLSRSHSQAISPPSISLSNTHTHTHTHFQTHALCTRTYSHLHALFVHTRFLSHTPSQAQSFLHPLSSTQTAILSHWHSDTYSVYNENRGLLIFLKVAERVKQKDRQMNRYTDKPIIG